MTDVNANANNDAEIAADLTIQAADLARQNADLVRQGERTVDNLKRLFAVVFALSFGIAGNGSFAKLKLAILPPGKSPPGWLWALNIEMIVVFLVTAAVFYHQSVKFLDIRYARARFPRPIHGASGPTICSWS